MDRLDIRVPTLCNAKIRKVHNIGARSLKAIVKSIFFYLKKMSDIRASWIFGTFLISSNKYFRVSKARKIENKVHGSNLCRHMKGAIKHII